MTGRMRRCVSVGAVLALALTFCTIGCSRREPDKPKAEKNAAKPGATAEAAAKGVPSPLVVNADNGTPNTLKLLVDGKPTAELKPYTAVKLTLNPGKHTFEFKKGDQPFDRMEATLTNGQLTVLNPGAASNYQVMTVYYVPAGTGYSRAPTVKGVTGQKLVQLDGALDLFTGLPSTLMLFNNKGSRERTKIIKLAPPQIPIGQACAVVGVNQRAYYQQDVLRAAKTLTAAPRSEEVAHALLAGMDSKNRLLVLTIFETIGEHAGSIPEARLVAWLTQPYGTGVAAPLGQTRVKGAAQVLLALGKSDVILAKLSDMPAVNQRDALSACGKAPPRVRRALADAAICKWSKEINPPLLHMVCADDFAVDEAFVKKVDAMIAAIPEARVKNQWPTPWGEKICKSAESFKPEFIVPRLQGYLAGPYKGLHDDALRALTKVEDGKALVNVYPNLEASQRKQVLNDFKTEADRQKKASPVGLALARKALGDEDRWVRQAGFRFLCEYGMDDDATTQALQNTVEGTSDTHEARELKGLLDAAILRMMPRDATEAQLRELVTSGPLRLIVAKAFLSLCAKAYRGKTVDDLQKELERLMASCKPRNRAWVLASLAETYRGRYATKMRKALYEKALRDRAEVVRGEGIRGLLNFVWDIGPESRKLHGMITALRDPAVKADLTREYDKWLIVRYEQMRRKKETRAKADKLMLDYASSPDPEVAFFALMKLAMSRHNTGDSEATLAPCWTKLYERVLADDSVSAQERRTYIRSRVKFENDDQVVAFYKLALTDKDPRTRTRIFSDLSQLYRKDKSAKVLALMQAVAEKETDRMCKEGMERTLKGLGH